MRVKSNKILRLKFLTVIILLSALMTAGAGSLPDTLTEKYLNIGIKHFNSGEYAAARDLFEGILAADPENLPASEYLKKTETAISSRIGSLDSMNQEAEKSVANGDYGKARSIYQDILKIEASNLEARDGYEKSDKLLKLQNRESFRSQNRKRLAKLEETARKYMKSGDMERAKTIYDEILALDPENAKAREFVSKQGTNLKEIAAAHVNELYSQALENYMNGNYKEAIKYFDNTTQASLKYFEALVLTPPLRLDTLDFIQECRNKIAEEEQKVENLAKEEVKKRINAMLERGAKFNSRGYYKLSVRELAEAKQLAEKNVLLELIPSIDILLEQAQESLASFLMEKAGSLPDADIEQGYNLYKEAAAHAPENEELSKKLSKAGEVLAEKYYQDGLNYFTSGKNTEAKAAFEKALYFNPAKKEASRALERVNQ